MQKRINKYLFAALLLIIASAFLLLTNEIYDLTLDDAKKNHQLQQLEMAKVVSEGTKFFLYHLARDLELLTGKAELKGQSSFTKEQADHFRKNYDETVISSVIIISGGSSPVHVSGKNPPDWISPEITRLLSDTSASSEKYSFLASDVFPDNNDDPESNRSFLLLFPVKNSQVEMHVIFVVNFDMLIRQFILPLKLSSNDFVWILDNHGRLIYHPRHQEMLFNSIFEVDDACMSCHVSFDDQVKIVRSTGAAVGEYFVKGDEPGKIFAFVPLQLENQRWNIAISTLLPDVISGLKERFRLFFILGVFILITLLTSVFLVYYFNTRRIKSEEEKKNLEKIRGFQEQLNHSSKLASIGELVDSVAHEINTPVGIISAHADSIILRDDTDHLFREELEIIKKQTRRISEYTRSLLNFSRRMPFNPEELDIVQLAEETIYLLNPRFREKNISVKKEWPEDSRLPVTGDKRQLEQVFINILNNSIDSIVKDGSIKISISKVTRRNKIIGGQPVASVKICFTDNGTGIKKQDINKIFDPFFTTKAETGTGLGLSIAKSIIQRHKGVIEVESRESRGTIFTIILPGKVIDKNELKAAYSHN